MLILKRFYFVLVLFVLFFCSSAILLSDETQFVPPTTLSSSSSSNLTAAAIAPSPSTNTTISIGTADPVLGNRIAKISNQLREIPKEAEQIWREYDITPYTKGRKFLDGSQPEQTIVDWILRKTGTKIWHTSPFGIISADSEKLYIYNTKDVQLDIANIVDRFIHPIFANESYSIRVISLSRPDWISRGHQFLQQPIPILSSGVQGWELDKEKRNLLLQELSKRNDFKEITSQHLIPNGTTHHVNTKQQRRYLRDIQPNISSTNGYAENWATIDEGYDLTFIPLATIDGWKTEAIIKLNITQINKMTPIQIDSPTTINPRQRIEIESPQIEKFNLDEQIRWSKEKILLLDLGTIPQPNIKQNTESGNIINNLTKNLSNTKKANVLLMIERINNQIINTTQNTTGNNNIYWNNRK
ncbi:MAG: hypothetical protein LBH59_10975 [Planctomycetaceae bacterium]|jgi:hypothetical protein|nr:hypothetical protein [Planctomycetaceae bacterium]